MKKIIKKCLNCDKEMELYPSDTRKFCCKKCYNEYTKKQTEYVDFVCEHCGKPFKRTAREVRRCKKIGTPIRFCSFECKEADWGKNRVEKVCPVCGKTFLAQHKFKDSDICCSPECAETRRQENQKPIVKICKHCGKEFSVPIFYLKKQEKRGQKVNYCSKECAAAGERTLPLVAYTCTNCGKTFNASQNEHTEHFCSGNCRLQWVKRNNETLICQQCGKPFEVNGYQVSHGRKFCSMECWNKARAIEHDSYAKCQHYLRSSQAYADWRIAVMQRAHFQCEKCGQKEQLHVHHSKTTLYRIAKKYDFDEKKIIESPEFNDIDNGECLCLSCHIKEHPYHKKLRNLKGQFCRLEFKTTKRLKTIRTELSGETVEKPQSEPKAS